MGELVVDTRELEGVTLVYPRGFINAHTVRLFEGQIRKAVDCGQFKLVVNCCDLSYIASAGLGAMMGAIEEIRGNGGDLRLAEVNETVRHILEMLGFDRLYRILPTEAEAVSSFRSENPDRLVGS